MLTSQNLNYNRIPRVDYVPAELKKGTKGNWIIEFYVLYPVPKTLKKIRRRVHLIKSIIERERLAKHMVVTVNEKITKRLESNHRERREPFISSHY